VVAEAQRRGIPAGVPLDATTDRLFEWAERGCRFVIAGEDHSLLRRAAADALVSLTSYARRVDREE